MKKLLIFSDWYLPGYKAGGPITSIHNLAGILEDIFEIYIITSDRDLGELCPYEGISTNKWLKTDKNTWVLYVKKSRLDFFNIFSLLKTQQYDSIYLNSMWSLKYSILPLLYQRYFKHQKIVLAPRGMLKESAMNFKKSKKKLFLFIIANLGLLKSVTFHATDKEEGEIIKNKFPKNKLQIVSNVPSSSVKEIHRRKTVGNCRLVFTGRIHPIKGLDLLLNAIKNIGYEITLEVIGPNEDIEYEDKCKSLADSLSTNITVNFHGALPYSEIEKIYKESHVFILPTKGENFGHAIYEAMLSGLPVIISDQTPWRGLQEKNVGFDLPLSDISEFENAIIYFAKMNNTEYREWSQNAKRFADSQINISELKDEYFRLFN